MNRYFFHIVSNNGFVSRDVVGAEFTDLDAVREEAFQFADDIRHDAAFHGASCREHIEVTDAHGTLLFRYDCARLRKEASEPAC
jgi:hypothetical protein